jgi:hypothetical protein
MFPFALSVLYFISCLVVFTRISGAVLNSNDGNGHTLALPDLWGKLLVFHHQVCCLLVFYRWPLSGGGIFILLTSLFHVRWMFFLR